MDDIDWAIMSYAIGRSKINMLYRIIRKALNYTQEEFANILNITAGSVNDIEEFKCSLNINEIKFLCHKLNFDKKDFLSILETTEGLKESHKIKNTLLKSFLNIK
jgi:transcriptional regulator with XRE-family HTH domain